MCVDLNRPKLMGIDTAAFWSAYPFFLTSSCSSRKQVLIWCLFVILYSCCLGSHIHAAMHCLCLCDPLVELVWVRFLVYIYNFCSRFNMLSEVDDKYVLRSGMYTALGVYSLRSWGGELYDIPYSPTCTSHRSLLGQFKFA